MKLTTTVSMGRERGSEEGFAHEVFDSLFPATVPHSHHPASPKYVLYDSRSHSGAEMPANLYKSSPTSVKMSLQQTEPQESLSCLQSYFSVQMSPAENLSLREDNLTQTYVLAGAIALQLTQEHLVDVSSL